MTTLDVFTTAATPWTATVHAVTDWTAVTPCDGWTARDLVEHVIATECEFFADRGVPLEGQVSQDDPATAWDEHRASVEKALADPAVPATEYEGWFGPTTVGSSFEQFYVFDLYVHRWDLATAVGLDTSLTDTELDRLEKDIVAWGDALYMEGICKPALEPPADADRTTKVLALLGRG
jgi:uncharacterized protein (TIGR03086 family)